LENLELKARQEEQELAQQKLAEARAGSSGASSGVLTPSAKLASAMPGASRLTVPSGGMLRKPATSSGANFLKKKPATSVNKLRVNKLSMSNGTKDEAFEDIEATQKLFCEYAKWKRHNNRAVDEAMAKKLQIEAEVDSATSGGNSTPAAPAPVAPTPIPHTRCCGKPEPAQEAYYGRQCVEVASNEQGFLFSVLVYK
jgi:hypothetical protein